jgi:hypothetical protein
MVLRQKLALFATCPLSGERSGQRIGSRLSTAVKSAREVKNEAHYLCWF